MAWEFQKPNGGGAIDPAVQKKIDSSFGYTKKLTPQKKGLNLKSFAVDLTIGHIAGEVNYIDANDNLATVSLAENQTITFSHIDMFGAITNVGSTLIPPHDRFQSFSDPTVVNVTGNETTIMKMYYDVLLQEYFLLKDFEVYTNKGRARDRFQQNKAINFPNKIMIGCFSIISYTTDMGSTRVEYFGVSKFGEIGNMYAVQVI